MQKETHTAASVVQWLYAEKTESDFQQRQSDLLSNESRPFGKNVLRDVFIWGEGAERGCLGDGEVKLDALSPKLEVHSRPKQVDSLNGVRVKSVTCGEYQTCALTFSGELYTWGDNSFGAEMAHRNCINIWTIVYLWRWNFWGSWSWKSPMLFGPKKLSRFRGGKLLVWGDGDKEGRLGHPAGGENANDLCGKPVDHDLLCFRASTIITKRPA
ncbi:hypothetical protein HAX54_046475 [Datura stramonium]|uniref:Uncharacterized protein n=1 Tax=Datura stramonium TaxID=4076 RepID=A0ABS8WKX6_DATST|nr:hypothetical protein [Datura stramonium]